MASTLPNEREENTNNNGKTNNMVYTPNSQIIFTTRFWPSVSRKNRDSSIVTAEPRGFAIYMTTKKIVC